MTRAQKHVMQRTLFYLLLLVIAFYLIFPFYWALRSSITPDNQLFSTPVQYFPNSPTLGNYQLVLSNGNFLIVDDSGDTRPFQDVSEVYSQTELASRRSVALYIRPPNDQPFDEKTLEAISEASLEALETIGQASAAI